MTAADPPPYAGLVSRGAAFAIDATLIVVTCTLGYQLVAAIVSVLHVGHARNDGGALAYLLAVPVVFAVYCAGFWTLVERTPGMMLLGLRVVTVDGRPLHAGRAALRAIGYWISAILFLGFAWIAVDRRSQGFHDKLAGTFVVYDWGDDAGG